ncbi:membrane hypothetical protein [Vibrio chagasii]|nr:membrane hypothetical protein [Vibrio chagasii]
MNIYILTLCLIGLLGSLATVIIVQNCSKEPFKASFKDLVKSTSPAESTLGALSYFFKVLFCAIPFVISIVLLLNYSADNLTMAYALSGGSALGALKIMIFDFTDPSGFAFGSLVTIAVVMYWFLMFVSFDISEKNREMKGDMTDLEASWLLNATSFFFLVAVLVFSPRVGNSLSHYDFSLEHGDLGELVKEYCPDDSHLMIRASTYNSHLRLDGFCGGTLNFNGDFNNPFFPDFSLHLGDAPMIDAIENVEGRMNFNYMVTSSGKVIHMIDIDYIPPRSTIEQLKLASLSLSETLRLHKSDIQSSLVNFEEWNSAKL